MLRRNAYPAWRRVSGVIAPLVVSAAVATLLGLMYAAVTRPLTGGRASGADGTNSVGAAAAVQPKPAPDFQLTTFDGQTLRLSELRGKQVVVNFWASWCTPCRQEAADLERSWQSSRDSGVVFVGVNTWDRPPAARQFLQTLAPTYPNGPDASGQTAVAYGVHGLPETFFVDREGQIVRKWIGPITERQLAAALQALAG